MSNAKVLSTKLVTTIAKGQSSGASRLRGQDRHLEQDIPQQRGSAKVYQGGRGIY